MREHAAAVATNTMRADGLHEEVAWHTLGPGPLLAPTAPHVNNVAKFLDASSVRHIATGQDFYEP